MATDISSSSTESYDSTVNAPAAGDPRTSASVRNPMQNMVNRTRFSFKRLQRYVTGDYLPIGGLFPAAASVASSTFTIAGHGLSANDPVRVESVGGSVPSPLAAEVVYFAVGGSLTSNTFQVSATSGGSAITLTDNGSGTINVAKQSATVLGQQLLGIAAGIVGGNNTWTGAQVFQNISAGVAGYKIGPGPITLNRSVDGLFVLTSTGAAAADLISIPTTDSAKQSLRLPHGATLLAVDVGVDPVNATPPAGTANSLTIYKVSLTSGAVTNIALNVLDTTAGASYGNPHHYNSGVLSEVIDRTSFKYFAKVSGESGTGAAAVSWFSTTWTCSMPALDTGAA